MGKSNLVCSFLFNNILYLMKNLVWVIAAVLLVACKEDPKNIAILNVEDYDSFLDTSERGTFNEATTTVDFWSKRLRPDTTGVGDLAPLAGGYEQLFQQTGKGEYLVMAEELYRKGWEISANNKDGFARHLAHNYVSQHRFSEAYELLNETLNTPSNKHQTKLMLFDVAMEVGEYNKAYEYLNEVTDMSDYNYLIRLSKWSDYKGNLDDAIRFMEKAREIADSRDSKPLKIWTYSNLGDYYGHAGMISKSYEMYLQTLKLQPDNAYVKKGLAWIAYAADDNTEEAHRILDSVMVYHSIPDYHLLKSEIYEYEGFLAKAEMEQKRFVEAIEAGNYGTMYNAYLIEYYSESNPSKAVQLAKEELTNRKTPEAYHLLALSELKSNNPTLALQIIEDYVKGKTFEPMALYHSALVYKANQKYDEVESIKKELMEASFELGPLLMREINEL